MLRSHYIPQFILRAFCEDDKIQYMDLASKTVEARNTRSVFSEYGYYPEQLEHDLCDKIERSFAPLHRKIIESRYKVILSPDEMLLLKKFLLVSVLRFKTNEYENDPILSKMNETDRVRLVGDFYENISKILVCKTKDELTSYYDPFKENTNISIWAYVRDVLGTYTVIVKTNNCKYDFLMPDRGLASYQSYLSLVKLDFLCEWLDYPHYREQAQNALRFVTPHDYTIFPLSRNMAVICMSPFFLMADDNPLHQKFELKNILGFGNNQVFKGYGSKMDFYGNILEYNFPIQQLSCSDVFFLNELLKKNAISHIAFANKGKLGIEI